MQSKLYNRADLAWRRDAWLRLHRPMSTRELDAVRGDWMSQLNRLPYLKMVKCVQDYGTDHLLTIRCISRFPAANLIIAKADIERIWCQMLSEGMESGHMFREYSTKFEFHFVALTKQNTTLSGFITIEAAPPSTR